MDDETIPGMSPITPETDPFKDLEAESGERAEKGERIRRTTSRAKKEASGPTALPKVGRNTALKSSLEKMYGTIAVGIAPFDMVCATEVAKNASVCADAWDNLARENESVRRILEKLVAGSAWGGVLMAHTPIIFAIAMHHGSDQMRMFVGRAAGMQAESA